MGLVVFGLVVVRLFLSIFLLWDQQREGDGVLFHTVYLAPFHGFTGLHKGTKCSTDELYQEVFITISAYSTS